MGVLDVLLPGSEVVLAGLNNPDLNGCTGVVLGAHQGERVPVVLHRKHHPPPADWTGGSWRSPNLAVDGMKHKPLAVRLRNTSLLGHVAVAASVEAKLP